MAPYNSVHIIHTQTDVQHSVSKIVCKVRSDPQEDAEMILVVPCILHEILLIDFAAEWIYC